VLQCLIFEDDHLLVVNKPAGMNTHSPSPLAGEGLYEWLRNSEPRWANLAIIQRLDKETSGVIVFSKTQLANRSLTKQFTGRLVNKKYILLTDKHVGQDEVSVRSCLVRSGERYLSRPVHAGGEQAETRFRVTTSAELTNVCPKNQLVTQFVGKPPEFDKVEDKVGDKVSKSLLWGQTLELSSCTIVEAQPLTGRTHQIRVHAAAKGFPILGDTLYGGTPAPRVYLHATEIAFRHPASERQVEFRAPADFKADPRLFYRDALIETGVTDAYRIIHGASDGWPGWYVDRIGNYLLSTSAQLLSDTQRAILRHLMSRFSSRGAYHKLLSRQVRKATVAEASPQLTVGEAAPGTFTIVENDLQFELSFDEGYSIGLFLDQRENRRRLMTGHVSAEFGLGQIGEGGRILNAFAYTCGFSVAAARRGNRTVSLDLSKKYLEWGKRNFALNRLDPRAHEFIYGDAFDWLRRFARRGEAFDIVLLDPPTFSQSKESGAFRAEKDFGKLILATLPVINPNGVLFASSNSANWSPAEFMASTEKAIHRGGRKILQQHYAPQPVDFPISRAKPGYLKTVWLRIQ
jgi:23S rRNA (cytosine1962-C5)-methyltransferase